MFDVEDHNQIVPKLLTCLKSILRTDPDAQELYDLESIIKLLTQRGRILLALDNIDGITVKNQHGFAALIEYLLRMDEQLNLVICSRKRNPKVLEKLEGLKRGAVLDYGTCQVTPLSRIHAAKLFLELTRL